MRPGGLSLRCAGPVVARTTGRILSGGYTVNIHNVKRVKPDIEIDSKRAGIVKSPEKPAGVIISRID